MSELPGLGDHWWDRFPAPPPPDPHALAVQRTAQLREFAAMNGDGEISE
jgi:hypothetical protein